MLFSYFHYHHEFLVCLYHLVDAKVIVRQIQVEIEDQKKSNLAKIKIYKANQ